MLLTLTQTAGPGAGRRLQLRSGQKLVVGRTEWADFAVADPLLAERHLEISCGGTGAALSTLQAEPETLLNGEPTKKGAVFHEDRIRVGGAEFVVALDPPLRKPKAAMDSEPDVTPRAADYLDRADLEFEAKALHREGLSPEEFLDVLVSAKDWPSAFRFAAAVIGSLPAADWMLDVAKPLAEEATPDERAILEAAAAWRSSENDSDRRAAHRLAEARKFKGLFGMLGLAIFWAGDDISPENSGAPFPPPPPLPPRGVASVLLLAAVRGKAPDADQRSTQYIELVRPQIADAK